MTNNKFVRARPGLIDIASIPGCAVWFPRNDEVNQDNGLTWPDHCSRGGSSKVSYAAREPCSISIRQQVALAFGDKLLSEIFGNVGWRTDQA
jgi:hypothetical protein